MTQQRLPDAHAHVAKKFPATGVPSNYGGITNLVIALITALLGACLVG